MTVPYAAKNPQDDARTQAEKICQEAYERWRQLYCDPDGYTDPGKMRAMVQARFEYQEAHLKWLIALRSEPISKNRPVTP